jgi:hypothetical protein
MLLGVSNEADVGCDGGLSDNVLRFFCAPAMLQATDHNQAI